MQPIPEIQAELYRLTAMAGGNLDMAELLRSICELAVAVVPTCVAVSISIDSSAGLFTITATSPDLAVVDAVQYLAGGPCVQCSAVGEEIYLPDVLDEKRWQLAAEASAANGIRSTLSMPLRDGKQVIGAEPLWGRAEQLREEGAVDRRDLRGPRRRGGQQRRPVVHDPRVRARAA